MNLVPEIRRRRAKKRGILQREVFFTSLSNTILILTLCCMIIHHMATLADSCSILFQVRSCCFSSSVPMNLIIHMLSFQKILLSLNQNFEFYGSFLCILKCFTFQKEDFKSKPNKFSFSTTFEIAFKICFMFRTQENISTMFWNSFE